MMLNFGNRRSVQKAGSNVLKVNVSKLCKTFSFERNKLCKIDVTYESCVKTESSSDVVRTSIVQLTFSNLKILLVVLKSYN